MGFNSGFKGLISSCWGWGWEIPNGYLSHFAIAHNFHGTLWEDAGCCGYIYTGRADKYLD